MYICMIYIHYVIILCLCNVRINTGSIMFYSVCIVIVFATDLPTGWEAVQSDQFGMYYVK